MYVCYRWYNCSREYDVFQSTFSDSFCAKTWIQFIGKIIQGSPWQVSVVSKSESSHDRMSNKCYWVYHGTERTDYIIISVFYVSIKQIFIKHWLEAKHCASTNSEGKLHFLSLWSVGYIIIQIPIKFQMCPGLG